MAVAPSHREPRTRPWENARSAGLAVAILLAAGLAQIVWGERISPGRGQGWDGRFYAEMARDFPGQVLGGKLDAYRLGRVLPSGMVAALLAVLGLPHDDTHIVTVFAFYNLALLAGVVVIWWRIGDRCELSPRGRWLGLLLLFVNFGVLRMPFYYPVSTDVTAFFLGSLLTYLYLAGSAGSMLAVLALGAFAWPSFLGSGSLLYVFARPDEPVPTTAPPQRAHWMLGALLAAAYLALIPGNPHLGLRPDRSAPIDTTLLPLSLAIVVGYIVLVSAELGRDGRLFDVTTWARAFRPRRALALVAVAILAHVTVESLSNGTRISDPGLYLRQLPVRPLIKPAIFVVAHAVYLGLVVPLLVVRWRTASQAARRLGPGFILFVAGLLALALTPESRQIVHGLTALCLLAVLALEGVPWPRWATLLVSLSALASSKVWLSLNGEGFMGKSDPFSYPAQRYFMNLGPWMAWENYFLQGGLALAVTAALALADRRARAAEADTPPPPLPRGLVRAGVVALVALTGAAAIEWAARSALDGQAAVRADGDGSRADPVVGWVNVPNGEVRVEDDEPHVVRFNAAGLRGPDVAEPKPGGARRIVLLGDGFTEGYAVTEEKTVRAVLERALQGTSCAAEVVNAGVAGYSTDQELLFFRARARQFQPDLVVLLLYSDDLAHNLRGRRGKPYVDLEDALGVREPAAVERERLRVDEVRYVERSRWHRSAALRLFSNALLSAGPGIRRRALAWGLAERSRPPFEIWPYAATAETRQMWAHERALLSAVQSDSAAAGSAFAVLYVPARWEIEDEAWTELLERYQMSPAFWERDRVARRLDRIGQELGIPVIDPRALLRSGAATSGPAYSPRSGLWTAAGHDAAARALAAFITSGPGCAGLRP